MGNQSSFLLLILAANQRQEAKWLFGNWHGTKIQNDLRDSYVSTELGN